ncbi:Vitamin K epoxide reductase complex subunit 1-like protein 1 [Blattella germanica]|nr:Vitamin K epoxide reductase complex subunit 1-like protein 1 [Blattella germanica]
MGAVPGAEVNKGIVGVCLVGLALSYYAYVVETSKEHDEKYEAMCDISEHMSCSKAFTSPYGRGFGLVRHIFGEDSPLNVPNSLGGLLFYCIVIALNMVNTAQATKMMLGLVVVSNLASVYLAYILYFVLYDFCVVCVSTYIVNFVNLVLVSMKLRRLSRTKDQKKKQS